MSAILSISCHSLSFCLFVCPFPFQSISVSLSVRVCFTVSVCVRLLSACVYACIRLSVCVFVFLLYVSV